MSRKKTTVTGSSVIRPFGLVAAAVFALTVAGTPVLSAAEDAATAMEESDARMANLLGPVTANAISLFKSEKFEEALMKCDEADQIIATTKHISSPQIVSHKSMISQLRSDIQAVWAKRQMEPLQGKFADAEKLLENNPEMARKIFKEVIAECVKNSAKNPVVKAESETLKTAAEGYLKKGDLLFATKKEEQIALRDKYVAEKVDPLLQESNAQLEAADKLIKEAQKLLDDHLYKKAYQLCLDAYEKCGQASDNLNSSKYSHSPKTLAKKSQIIALRRDIVQRWERAYVMDTRQKYLKAIEMTPKNLKEALTLVRVALARASEGRKELPTVPEELVDIETACTALLKSQEFQEAISLENIDVSLERRRSSINDLLIKGETLYRNKMFAKARDVLEEVYVLDPFNEKANIILGKIYRKINDTAWMRRENEVLERINEIEWKWVNPSRPVEEEFVDETPMEDDRTSEKASVYKKLQEIIIPEMSFPDEPVADVFKQIQERSKQLDPDKKGISIVFPAFREEKYVTLDMKNIPVGELIRYVCMYAGLKYKISHLGVTIGESSLDDMSIRTYNMSNTLYDSITGANAGTAVDLMGEGATDNPFEDSGDNGGGNKQASAASTSGDMGMGGSGGSESEGAAKLRAFFNECGIPFGPGTSVSYNSRANKLTVRNTPENLKTMAMLLDKIDVETNLVLVEAKIIEIAVSDLEELGFDWTLTHNNQDPQWMYGNAATENSSFGNSDTFSLGEAVINQTLVRHTGGSGTAANFSTEEVTSALNLITDMNIIPNFGKDGAYNLFLTIHAVDQSSRGEVIAAPKVLAKSGQEATIQMVQQMYFPEEWEDAELEEANNTYEYTPPAPELGEETPIGTTFIVNPSVSTNLRTITMTLKPEITSLIGWTDYDYQFIIGSIQSVGGDSQNYAAKMKMPEIAERSLETQLKIFDGETVVLGGVLQENSAKRDDKYPFLGEIPLVGTLFSNKASRATKQNLLIFVTPRLMGYNGVPVNSVVDNGRFDFNR